jgi:hypothetical protein
MTTTIYQAYRYQANVTKGPPKLNRLDHQAKISANVLFTLPTGRMAHLNASGELEPGVKRYQMGLLVMRGAESADVSPIQGANYEFYSVNPDGTTTCVVCSGGFQVFTTEFDTAQTYAYNEPLRAPVGNSSGDSATAGVLTNQGVIYPSATMASGATKYTAICGIVCAPAAVQPMTRNTVLSFWTVYLPGHDTE